MAGKPDPRPERERGRLPTVAELGGRCQVCGDDQQVERMHLLRGSHKEDVAELIMLGCGDWGRCRVHPRLDRDADPLAAIAVRAAMTARQERAILERRGADYLAERYPDPKELPDAA